MGPEADTTGRTGSWRSGMSRKHQPSESASSAETWLLSLTGGLNDAAQDSKKATSSARDMKPSGSRPSYATPGSFTAEFGVTRQKESQRRVRQVSAIRPLSNTA